VRCYSARRLHHGRSTYPLRLSTGTDPTTHVTDSRPYASEMAHDHTLVEDTHWVRRGRFPNLWHLRLRCVRYLICLRVHLSGRRSVYALLLSL
jgi:hypothetical protein